MDRITELPDIALEMILQKLPLLDAVRTSILSKKWRYEWKMVSKLLLGFEFFDTIDQKAPEIAYPSLVKGILLNHTGPLHELIIYIPELDPPRIEEINLAIHIALKSGIRELTVFTASPGSHALPSFLFSFADQLTTLKWTDCVFNPPPEVRGFPNLETLELISAYSNLHILSSFISNCPKLRNIALTELDNLDQHLCIHAPSLEVFSMEGSFGSVLLLEAQNLVSLRIFWEDLRMDYEKSLPYNDYTVQFFSNLCNIKYLELGGFISALLGANCVPRKLTELGNLKIIDVLCVDLGRPRDFRCLLTLFRSSPNLQQLGITMCRDEDRCEDPYFPFDFEDCLDCRFHHLRTVKISEIMGTRAELKMIEILLRLAPVLQIMSIKVNSNVGIDAKFEILQQLLRFSRASPVAQIVWLKGRQSLNYS